MYLKSLKVTDYSTGSSYAYSDKSGSWKSIVAEGGQVEGNDGAEPQSTQSAPPVTSTVENIPIPWSGTHRETSSFVTPSIWPWVPTPTTSTGSSMTSLPSGWTFSGSGSVQPPSASSVSEQYPVSFLLSTGVSLLIIVSSLWSGLPLPRQYSRGRGLPPLALRRNQAA